MKDFIWPFSFTITNDGYVRCGTHDHCSGMYFLDELKSMKSAIEKTLKLYEKESITDSYVKLADEKAMKEEFSCHSGATTKRKTIKAEDDLYLIKDMVSGLLKIGRSKDAKKRLKQLQSANGHKLELLCVIKKKGNIEDKLHEKFSELNTNGEWYKYSEDIINEYTSLGGTILIESISKNIEIENFVERMYKLYPTKCPVRNITTGKSYKDKQRIKALLKHYSMNDIEKVFKKEINDKLGKHPLKNLSTFLNNFPDPNDLFSSVNMGYPQSIDDVKTDDIQPTFAYFQHWVANKMYRVWENLRGRWPNNEAEYKKIAEHTKGGVNGLCYVVLVFNRDGWDEYKDDRGFVFTYFNYIKANGLYKE